MDYTQVYRKIYAELKTDQLPHEPVHKSAISICEAISNLYSLTKEYSPSIINVVSEIIEDIYQKDLNIQS